MDQRIISHYRILRQVGSGGMGAVYEAEDLNIGRRVALKLLPKEFGVGSGALDRFGHEAMFASTLNHPNIRTVYEVEAANEEILIGMEWLEGETLRERINRGPLNIDDVFRWTIQITHALGAAHSVGIVHRDVTPENIFITVDGRAKVLDFGLARLADEVLGESGQVTSRIGYMPPEQLRQKRLDPRSDLFSFGAVLYEMVAGFPPFREETSASTIQAVMTSDPIPRLRLNPNLPNQLENILSRSLEKDPERRYQSAGEIRADLVRAFLTRLESILEVEGRGEELFRSMGSAEKASLPEAKISLKRQGAKSSRFDTSDIQVIKVLYATDRKYMGESDPRKCFANERAEGGELSWGVCEVTIPKTDRHKIGGLEKPSLFRLEFKEDPTKHVILVSVKRKTEEAFFAELQRRVSESQRKEAFVFVHGYLVTFEDAVRRTAQFACDLQFDGAPILYSWPSRGKWWQYSVDETNVTWSIPHLESFLRAVAQKSGARTVHLIAHSMGNRALASALEKMVDKNSIRPQLFRHIVLTAPDIDRETFDQLAAAIVPAGERVTMYSNYRDRALLLSKLFHLYRRAGSSIVVMQGMDTIDASAVDTSLTRHSYFGSSRTVIADIFSLISDGKPPKMRFGMRERSTAKGPYYVFRP